MFNVFGYTLYIDGFSLFLYALLYLPLAAGVIALLHNTVIRWWPSSSVINWKVFGPLSLLVLTLPLWDVMVTSVRMKSLCEDEAGVKVYKTVHADGLRYWTMNPHMIAHGFTFTEGDGPGGHKYRWTVRDGQIVEERIEDFTSRYGRSGRPDVRISQQIRRHGSATIDEVNQEILGEEVYFTIWPGWFETLAAHFFGAEIGPNYCGRPDPYDLLFQTIYPAPLK